MTDNKVTPDNLNAVMEFDCVVRVHPDGTVTTRYEDSPYFELNVNPEGVDEFTIPAGWELLTGYTGQYSYNGPVMHPSEFIGGGMARHILETPGDYVALIVNGYCTLEDDTECNPDTGCDCEPAGWAVAFKPLEESAPGLDLGPKDENGFYRGWGTMDVPRGDTK